LVEKGDTKDFRTSIEAVRAIQLWGQDM
jgi:hypothetical protein